MIKRLILLLAFGLATAASWTGEPPKQAPPAPAIQAAKPKIKLALWGDSRENLDQACEHIASVLLNDITDWDVQVHSGDFTHHGSEEDWQRTLHYKGIDQLFVKGRFLMTTSNHDCDEKGSPGCRAVYDRHTKDILPVNSLDHTTHFYAWDKGNVHIVFCDGFFTTPATMQAWLDAYRSEHEGHPAGELAGPHHPLLCLGQGQRPHRVLRRVLHHARHHAGLAGRLPEDRAQGRLAHRGLARSGLRDHLQGGLPRHLPPLAGCRDRKSVV